MERLQFEYLVDIRRDGDDAEITLMDYLDKRGEEGWELVAVIPQPFGYTRFYMKRPLKHERAL